LQRDLCALLDIPPAQEWIEVYLFRDRASYERYMRRHLPELPTRRALYVKRGGPGMVFAYRDAELGADLRHETTHALLHAVLPSVPLWLDEGLAEYFETPRHRRPQGHPYLADARKALADGPPNREPAGDDDWATLETLEALGPSEMMEAAEYKAAWAWTHWMLNGPELAGRQLRQYLADLRGQPTTEHGTAKHGTAGPASSVTPLSRRLAAAFGNPRLALQSHFRWQTVRAREQTPAPTIR
jgi:hypothetical protein